MPYDTYNTILILTNKRETGMFCHFLLLTPEIKQVRKIYLQLIEMIGEPSASQLLSRALTVYHPH